MYPTWKMRPWPQALVGALTAVVSACTDTPTTVHRPPSSAPSFAASEAAGRDTVFVPNARKYSDAGQHPSSARAGSATVAAQALLARDGTADVEIVAGSWNGWSRSRRMRDEPDTGTTLTKVQLKAFAPGGTLLYTRNFTGLGAATATLGANGLLRGGKLQVQANVVGADGPRTGVVTVEAPVRLRPDLAVSALRPPRAALNSAIPIVAVVRELNGDLGAWADCVLFVDGVERDRVHGFWIDAGGTVTCAFSHQFRTLGDARLEIRVERVAPGDYDGTNNTWTGTMPVIRVPSSFSYYASFEDRFFTNVSRDEGSWSWDGGRQGGEYVAEDTSRGRSQQSLMIAYMPRTVAFPLTELFARQATRDEVAHAALFQQLPADWTFEDFFVRSSCVSRGIDHPATGRAWLYLCSYQSVDPAAPPLNWTSIQYDRYAGDVTYASRGHSRYWNRDLGIDDVYSWNDTFRDISGRFVRYGLEYGFFIRIVDGGAVFTTNPLVGLLPFEQSYRAPRACWSWEDAWGSSRSCSEWSMAAHGVSGWVQGEPTP